MTAEKRYKQWLKPEEWENYQAICEMLKTATDDSVPNKDLLRDEKPALEALAECRRLLREARDTFIWCSGSADFALDGQAGKYWQKTVLPLMDAMAQAIDTGRRDAKD